MIFFFQVILLAFEAYSPTHTNTARVFIIPSSMNSSIAPIAALAIQTLLSIASTINTPITTTTTTAATTTTPKNTTTNGNSNNPTTPN